MDYSSYCGIDDPLFQRQLVAEGDRWGLVAKMTCDDHETSLPGLKLLINTPASLLALIKYLLKCFLAGKKCCIVNHFGQTRNGFQLWLRLLKAERGIPQSIFSVHLLCPCVHTSRRLGGVHPLARAFRAAKEVVLGERCAYFHGLLQAAHDRLRAEQDALLSDEREQEDLRESRRTWPTM